MRVLQLIDSLEAGGAERMAVNIANKLCTNVDSSHLCATRKEGLLKSEIDSNVGYFFLAKKSSLDIKSIFKLLNYVKSNRIDIIHAHSTSYFLATLVKFLNPSLKIFWHDHYGISDNLVNRPQRLLKLFSRFFNAIISVNQPLADWAQANLNCLNVIFLRNFIYRSTSQESLLTLGGLEKKRIICVANFRPQKDHINLLKAFGLVQNEFPEYSLHLFGQINNDDCSEEINSFIRDQRIENVFIYGSVQNVAPYLEKCDIGVLSSTSEGLPLALLEYGLSGLPVVCTNVGQCAEVIGNDGILVQPSNEIELYEGIKYYIENTSRRESDATRFQSKIKSEYSEDTFIPALLKIYQL